MGITSRPGRAGLAVAGVAALGTSFLLGVVVGGGAGTTVAPPGPVDPPLRLAGAALTLPGSCDALLESYVRRGVERVGPYGWDFPAYAAMEGEVMSGDTLVEEAVPAPAGSRVVEQRSSETGTNVQEAGVDEPDVVKTDGELLVRVHDGELLVVDVSGTAPVELSDTDLPAGVPAPELLLAGDTVVVTGTTPEGAGARETRVLSYDVSDPAAPVLVDHRGYDAGLVRAVQHGDVVRLVLGSGLPDLDFVEPRFWRDAEEAREKNQDVVADSEIGDWLPGVTTYDEGGVATGSEQLLDCGRVTVPRDAATLGTMAVVGFEADDPTDVSTIGVATDTRLAYVSATRLYLATSDASPWGCCVDVMPVPPAEGVWPQPPSDVGRSRIHAFSLAGETATYVASGAVDGVLADRWSMDEHDGVLRLALGPSAETANSSSVVTLHEDGADLEEVGRVDGLGPGEEIKAVRWFDDLAIVVTFRQVDPLYPVDLGDPDDPRLLGELKIPGFSEYLHPISGQRLIGTGQDASLSGALRGAQAALFDVSDLTDPRQSDVVDYRRNTVAAAGSDPRQFTWLPAQDTALTVVTQGWEGTTGWVSVLEVSGDRLANRMVEVEHGPDVGAVRLVPLPDGRVVLVTADDVAFFDV